MPTRVADEYEAIAARMRELGLERDQPPKPAQGLTEEQWRMWNSMRPEPPTLAHPQSTHDPYGYAAMINPFAQPQLPNPPMRVGSNVWREFRAAWQRCEVRNG